ncbi:SRPBCC family protein [Georgenia sp. H159]|uniref:SRPBCC family protein n=1 Tax=Georgenia sp. H159 TaxID=3076115 RepID=UPI002D79C77F|nr:SRPBCC family protein [Georgenia sp. H159]
MDTEAMTTTEVEAPVGEVWAVLTAPDRWPTWTASMDEVELLDGRFGPGARVRVVQPRLRPAVWTVTDYDEGSRFTWTSTSPGVTTTGEHVLVPVGPDRTELRLRLRHEGPLAWLAHLLFGSRTRRYVALEADGLKRAAEQRARAGAGPDGQ